MRKVIMILVAIVSLSTGIVYSQNFVGFQQNITTESYIDLDSVSVNKYAPPYYIIDVNYGHKLLGQQEIYVIKERFLYDYDHQEVKVSHVAQNHKDKYGNWSGWVDYAPREPADVKPGTIGYTLANLAFYKAYHMAFNKEFQVKYANKLEAYK